VAGVPDRARHAARPDPAAQILYTPFLSVPAGRIGDMLTMLLYVLIVGVVAAVLFLLASAVFGRSEELGPLPRGTTATVLPAQDVTGDDVHALRFQQVLRGYKASEVDWALERLGAEIDALREQLTRCEQLARREQVGEHRE
jgi:DivIVA domain-containing protein